MDAPINFRLALNVRHPEAHGAADAFWQYWNDNGETHKHGYYESTWGAINRAIRLVGVIPHDYGQPPAERPSDIEQLKRFYGVDSLEGVIEMQGRQIEGLQARLKREDPFAYRPVRV